MLFELHLGQCIASVLTLSFVDHYYASLPSFQVLGFHVFAVRLPIIIAVLVLSAVTYSFGRWAYSQKAGLYAATILVSCIGMFLFTRIMIPEAILALGAALVVGIGFLLAYWFRRQQQHGRTATTMLITMFLLFICANRAHVQFEPVLSSRTIAEEILQRWEPGAKIVFNGNYQIGSSLGFYNNQQILLLNGRKFNLEYGSRYSDAPPIFLNYEDVRQL